MKLSRAGVYAATTAWLAVLTVPSNSRCAVLVAGTYFESPDSILKYDDDGTYLGPAGYIGYGGVTAMALSPDQSKLYVATGLNQVLRFDYDKYTSTLSNQIVFADGSDGLNYPVGIQLSRDGNRVYISSFQSYGGVAQFTLDGASAGDPIDGLISGGPVYVNSGTGEILLSLIEKYTGLALAPDGRLLVGGYSNGYQNGAVAISDATLSTIGDFTGPQVSVVGAWSLLVVGNDLYVSRLSTTAGAVRRFNATTGELDADFSIDGLYKPQSLAAAPSGGLLIATEFNGVFHYDFNGNAVGDGFFDEHSRMGYLNATAVISVPTYSIADFNADHYVNGADLGVWQSNFGSMGNPSPSRGDADMNGRVDGNDFLLWQRSLGSGPDAGSQGVPEPAGSLLWLTLTTLTVIKRSTRRRLGIDSTLRAEVRHT